MPAQELLTADPPTRQRFRKLNPREELFVAHYCQTLNGSKAAIAAGYNPNSAAFFGSTLLNKPNVQAAIEAAHLARLLSVNLKTDDVLRELMYVAFADVSDCFDESGDLLPIRKIPRAARRAIASLEVIIKNAAAGDGHTDKVHRIRFWDKNRALETLAKHLGLLQEHIKVDADVELSWKE